MTTVFNSDVFYTSLSVTGACCIEGREAAYDWPVPIPCGWHRVSHLRPLNRSSQQVGQSMTTSVFGEEHICCVKYFLRSLRMSQRYTRLQDDDQHEDDNVDDGKASGQVIPLDIILDADETTPLTSPVVDRITERIDLDRSAEPSKQNVRCSVSRLP